jgi:hypothetical protein
MPLSYQALLVMMTAAFVWTARNSFREALRAARVRLPSPEFSFSVT